MKYKVWNPERDMKIKVGSEVYTIKRGEKISLSQIDYQHLAQVYGMAVKGEKEYAVRTTAPVQIEQHAEQRTEQSAPVKKRKSKKR